MNWGAILKSNLCEKVYTLRKWCSVWFAVHYICEIFVATRRGKIWFIVE